MYPLYHRLHDYISDIKAVNCHSHHEQDNFFVGLNLERILGKSYVQWSGVEFGDDAESRARYLGYVRYKSFFRSLQNALMKLYGFSEELGPDNWDIYSETVAEHHKDPAWQIYVLTDICRYRTTILDAYWDPGSKNGHPEVFDSTFRVDSLFFGYDKNTSDHDGNNAYRLFGAEHDNIDDYMDFVKKLITEKIAKGSVCLKNAIPYDRNISYKPVGKNEANRVFQRSFTKEDIVNFQDYFFHEVCSIAAELNVPIQCHTGMGCLDNTRAINMLDVIRQHPGTRFSLMHGSFPWCSDILAYLDLYPNVFVDICWLPILSPSVAESMLHALIEVGTSDRVVWGCDTWTSEESLGARMTLNDVLARVLKDKIKRGYFGFKDAETIADNILKNNARALFGIGG
ncbi:MAG: amidohydrolase [Synergistaceae bacterium]|nr:amidohydrolase [Synergistaceae bacterium]